MASIEWPKAWFATCAFVLVFAWTLMASAELLLEDQDVIFAFLGSSALLTAAFTTLFLWRPSHVGLMIMFLSSAAASFAFVYLLYVAEDELNIFAEALKGGETRPKAIFDNVDFPPKALICLQVAKVSGAFFGLIALKVMLTTICWTFFETLFTKEIKKDEDDEDLKRRAESLLGIVIAFTLIGVGSFVTVCVFNATTAIDVDGAFYLDTKSRFVFSVCVLLFAISILEFRLYPSWVKERRTLLGAFIVLGVSLWHLMVISGLYYQVESLRRFVMRPQNVDSAFCVDFDNSKVCVESFRVCDGKVDLKGAHFTLNGRRVFYPDELYCFKPAVFVLAFNYACGLLGLLLALVVAFKTCCSNKSINLSKRQSNK